MTDALAAGRFTELRQRLFFLIGAILVFRIGSFIAVPGIDAHKFAQVFEQQKNTILGLFNMFGGGALERFSLFALGVMPYISASIIIQLLTKVHPKLEQLSKEGASGRRKITQYTRFFTLLLAAIQAFFVAKSMLSTPALVIVNPFTFYFSTVVTLVAGTMFLMWLGEQITERGIGNGMSMLIFSGIVSDIPPAIARTFNDVSTGSKGYGFIFFLLGLMAVVIMFVIFMERGQRRITVNYAKRQQGRKLYAAQSSYFPLKINMAGVIPPIFASSLILFPATIIGFSGQAGAEGVWGAVQRVTMYLHRGEPLYFVMYGGLIIFFAFFYTALMFDPKDTADNLKRSGAFVPGVRPGEQTANYIDSILGRITLVGALYLTSVCLLPDFLTSYFSIQFTFGGTSLLIVVVVVMDFMAQVQAHLMSHQYESLMKKANLKNPGAGFR
ncbi:MAG: preprotein translocase subunit SecY [Gammaproteobacteria bacterium]|nr:preprotein translocase subunit SecY [Gammaproteobacteria bacterium]